LSIFCSFSAGDVSRDDSSISEDAYFKEVKKNMGITDADNTSDAGKVDGKVKIKINYFSYVKIIVVLALVLLSIYLIFLFIKKTLNIKTYKDDQSSVITSQTLGPGKQLQVVYIHGKYLILGVTNDNINLIGEITDPKEIERLEIYQSQKKIDEGNSFVDVISEFFKKTFSKKVEKRQFDYEVDSLDYLKEQRGRIDKLKE